MAAAGARTLARQTATPLMGGTDDDTIGIQLADMRDVFGDHTALPMSELRRQPTERMAARGSGGPPHFAPRDEIPRPLSACPPMAQCWMSRHEEETRV